MRATTRPSPAPAPARATAAAASFATLFAGLLCVSTAGPFLVMAHMNAYAAVFWRMALASPLFLGYALATGGLRAGREHARELATGAALLSLHFVLWVKAFDLTDYASNLVLLVAQPITAAALSVRSGERRAGEVGLSVALAAVGLLVIAGGDLATGARALLGDALCVLAGAAIALFYQTTRRTRAELPLATFMGATFALGAAMVLPVAWLARAPVVAYSARAWAWLLALVLVTTVGGHGLMNRAARSVKLFTLNIVIVLEPAIAIAMGAVMFGATVRSTTLGGAALLAAAVVLGLRSENAVPRTPST